MTPGALTIGPDVAPVGDVLERFAAGGLTPAALGVRPHSGHEAAMLAGDWWAGLTPWSALALADRIDRVARCYGLRAEIQTPAPEHRRALVIWRPRARGGDS